LSRLLGGWAGKSSDSEGSVEPRAGRLGRSGVCSSNIGCAIPGVQGLGGGRSRADSIHSPLLASLHSPFSSATTIIYRQKRRMFITKQRLSSSISLKDTQERASS